MRKHLVMAGAVLLGALMTPAQALCSRTSIEQDFRDADVVVRARIVAETQIRDDEPSAALRRHWGNSFPVRLTRLRVIELFKGRPGPRINVFQEVNSGRFDMAWDRDYLLFLTYHRSSASRPPAARGSMYVRNTCGPSALWTRVPAEARTRLATLARGR